MAKAAARETRSGAWSSLQAYSIAVVCLALGVAAGYALRGAGGAGDDGVETTSSDPIMQAVDRAAAPLLAELRQHPNDPALLARVGNVYYDAQQYRVAADYYERALKLAPGDATVRGDLGSSYYLMGDKDKALAEYAQTIAADPGNANALFNLGMIRWRDKSDPEGAVAAWQQLLDKNPNHPRRAEVQELILRARQHGGKPAGRPGPRG
jgi:cytochrome c-type biogenesis protein CcmH/NrfG